MKPFHVPHNEVRKKVVAALCNICILTKNQKADSASAWVGPLDSLAYSHAYALHVLLNRVEEFK